MILERLVLGKLETNCYILGDETTNEVVVFDPADDSKKIIDFIESKNYKVKYIILTHAHIDHIIALDDLKNYTNAQIVIHECDKDILNNDHLNLALYFGAPSPKSPADIVVKDGDKLKIGKYEMKFIFTPGHNSGSMCILCDNVLIAGDTLFLESVGRTDHYGGDYKTIISSLNDKLMLLDDSVKVYPGHGDSTTIAHERKHNKYVRGNE